MPHIRQALFGHYSDAPIDLVLALENGDPEQRVGAADATTCNAAADILLSMGEARLLCKLVHLKKSIHFQFHVCVFGSRATHLANIAASWPQEVVVSISVDTHAHADTLRDLQVFLRAAPRASLNIMGHESIPNAHALAAWLALAQQAQRIPLVAVTLTINPYSTPLLQALRGMTVGSVTIHEMPLMPEDSGLPQQSDEQQISAYESAAIEFVRTSGTRVLKLPARMEGETLPARLLAIRSAWDTLQLGVGDPSAIKDWTIGGVRTIGRLELVRSKFHYRFGSLADTLEWAEMKGVHTIVFDDPVGICAMVAALDLRLWKSTYVFERIEARFFEDHTDDESVMEEAFILLASSPTVVRLGVFPDPPHAVTPLRETLKLRLNVIGGLNGLTPTDDRVLLVQRCREKRWDNMVERVGNYLLRDDEDDADLANYLSATLNALIPGPRQEEEDESPVLNNYLEDKLRRLQWRRVDHKLIQGAIAHCVSHNPAMGPKICLTLASMGFALRERSAKEWDKLGERFAQTWLGDGIPAVRAKVAPPTPIDPHAPPPVTLAVATGVPVVPEPAPVPAAAVPLTRKELIDLVTPSDETTLVNLTEYVLRTLANLVETASNLQTKRVACQTMLRLLQHGIYDPAPANDTHVASLLAHILLTVGQGRVLKHLVDQTPSPCVWALPAKDEKSISALQALMPWPRRSGCNCVLTVPADTSAEQGERIRAFAMMVSPDQLELCIDVQRYAVPAVVENIIRDRAGMSLRLIGGQGPFDAGPLTELLTAVRATPLTGFMFRNISSNDNELVQAASLLVQASGAKQLWIHNCTPLLTHALVSIRRWDSLTLVVDADTSRVFQEGKVSAEQLYLRRFPVGAISMAVEAFGKQAEAIVAHCNDLRSLMFPDTPVDVRSLARALDGGRPVRSVNAALTMVNPEQAHEALTILQRNTSLVHINLQVMGVPLGYLALTPAFNHQLIKLCTRNRLRHPVLAAEGVGNALGLAVGGDGMRDVGGIFGRYLSTRDVVALASTHKAAYVASRLPWETEIDRLAALFPLADASEFKTRLGRQLSQLDTALETPIGASLDQATPATTLGEKVSALQNAGLTDDVIGQALGRAFFHALAHAKTLAPDGTQQAALASSCVYPAAMVSIGALSAEVWLREFMGIDVKAQNAPLILPLVTT